MERFIAMSALLLIVSACLSVQLTSKDQLATDDESCHPEWSEGPEGSPAKRGRSSPALRMTGYTGYLSQGQSKVGGAGGSTIEALAGKRSFAFCANTNRSKTFPF